MKIFAFIFFCFLSVQLQAQSKFSFISKKHQLRFELVGNLVILSVKVNGVPLSFLLDTGVKETILFTSTQDSIPLENIHKVKFSGIGIEDGVEGVLAVGNKLEVGGILQDSSHNIFVINGEELDISSHIGMPINGIIGGHLFEQFVVQINYIKNKISLFDPQNFPAKLTKKYKRVPITIERDRPYTQVNIQLQKTKLQGAKMLIDMGNSDGLLIFPFTLDSFEVSQPNVYEFIGRGFNGDIFGKRNRISSFDWEGFHISQPIVSYPDSNAVHSAKLANARIGSIGNQVLRHFHIFFNFQSKEIYLKTNKNFGKPFEFNLSGMDVKHDGLSWSQRKVPITIGGRSKENTFEGINAWQSQEFKYEFKLLPVYIIAGVRDGSPAERAGVQKNDLLLKINGKKVENMKLSELLHRLQHDEGDRIKLQISRNGIQKEISFILADPIPYVKN